MTFILTVKNTDQVYTNLMKLKFNMHVLTIEDDLYSYLKQVAFTLSEKNILAFNLLKK